MFYFFAVVLTVILNLDTMSQHFLVKLMESCPLVGKNFKDWLRHLRIALNFENISYVIEVPMPIAVSPDSSQEEREAFQKWEDDNRKAKGYMLASMNRDLQMKHENARSAFDIIVALEALYGENSRVEEYNLCASLFNMKLREGLPPDDHVIKMINHMTQLDVYGVIMPDRLKVNLILQSLPYSFKPFITNYNLNRIERSLPELLNELQEFYNQGQKGKGHEDVHMASSSKTKKKPKKQQKKGPKVGPKKKEFKKGTSKAQKANDKAKDKGTCFHCGKDGHWKRNCPLYLESLKKAKTGMFHCQVIEHELNVNSMDYSWILDSAATSHICVSMQALQNSSVLTDGEIILRMANGARVAAEAIGSCQLELPSGHILRLCKVLYFANATRNIISISMLCKNGYCIHFNGNECLLHFENVLVGKAINTNGLYILEHYYGSIKSITSKRIRTETNPKILWHHRLGHIGERRLIQLGETGILNSLGSEPYPTCESCLQGKMTKQPFKGKGERAKELLDLIHTDVCGPFSTVAMGGYQYFITFTDDKSRYGYLYLMKHKSESFEKFKEYKNEVEKQTGKSIKMLRSDRGGEYLSTEFLEFLKDNGIISQLSPPYTPQLNGVSERRNRTLLDMVRSMVSFTDLPMYLWGYALQTAAHILNKVPSKSVHKTPYEIWTGSRPSLNYIKIWGCPAYVKLVNTDKLESKSEKGRFIGYPKDSLGYYFYFPADHRVIISRNARFLENEFLEEGGSGRNIKLEVETNEPQTDIADDGMSTQQTSVSDTNAPTRKSSRVSKPPERYGLLHEQDFESFLVGETDHGDDPRSYEEAILDRDSGKWLEAMNSEIESMHANQVWTLVDPPEGIVPIGCKWVFKRKIGQDGKVETFKARLVAKGYTQKQGLDYEETFSPVAMIKSIRIMLAIAAYHDYEIWQMDVKTAFLNGFIEENIYMQQPVGFVCDTKRNQVCKLHRSIYGLKQASRSWNIRFDETIKAFGFVKNPDEPCVYKWVKGHSISFLILYVDDILLMGNDVGMMTEVKVWLSRTFSMKDLGEATYILGIRVYRDRSKRLIGLSQRLYIERMLKRFSMENSKRGLLPFTHGLHLSKDMGPKTDEERQRMRTVPYASAIGSLMYAMLCTRPDIAYAVSVTSRYQANPGERHWTAVKSILKYLRRTKDLILSYGCPEMNIEGYSDSDFQSDLDDRKSTSGFIFTCNGGAVSWKSSKQTTTADSTTEAEYIAASEAGKEAVWMRKFVVELGVVPNMAYPITIFCDNTGAIAQAKEPRAHQKSKHIQRKYHILREFVGAGEIIIQKIPSAENVADPLTKAMTQKQLDHHLEKMGMRYNSEWL